MKYNGQLIFATGNQNKIKEVAALLPDTIHVGGLDDINCTKDLPENQDTLDGNALEKARYVYDKHKANCFSEDTGLEVFELNGEPGVYSARYAGPEKDNEKNIDLLLEKLQGSTDRRARFRTVIALIIDGEEFTFEGIVNGTIRTARSGKEGFGYDPIFQADGQQVTFAEMKLNEKAEISHRGKAVRKLLAFFE